MTRGLLDVNVLLALLDSDHVNHIGARRWLTEQIEFGWASCAITQNGFVRIISQPQYPHPIPPAQAIALLEEASDTRHHEFWPCEVSMADPAAIVRTRVLGPRQVTGVYLLALAVKHGGRLVTFDRALSAAAVPGAGAGQLVIL